MHKTNENKAQLNNILGFYKSSARKRSSQQCRHTSKRKKSDKPYRHGFKQLRKESWRIWK